MNYLASPPLVVAYALAGTMDIDLTTDPLGTDADGRPVHLADLWPSDRRGGRGHPGVAHLRRCSASATRRSSTATSGGGRCRVAERRDLRLGHRLDLRAAPAVLRGHDGTSPAPVTDIDGARVLAMLGDSVTTDHISPAGSIGAVHAGRPATWPSTASSRADFNSYGARRGNHEVMMRGTFANVRLRNQLAPGTEGGVHPPPARRRGDHHLRGRRALRGRGGAAGGAGRQGVRHRARAATGRPRAPRCSGCGRSSPRATSASTAPT